MVVNRITTMGGRAGGGARSGGGGARNRYGLTQEQVGYAQAFAKGAGVGMKYAQEHVKSLFYNPISGKPYDRTSWGTPAQIKAGMAKSAKDNKNLIQSDYSRWKIQKATDRARKQDAAARRRWEKAQKKLANP